MTFFFVTGPADLGDPVSFATDPVDFGTGPVRLGPIPRLWREPESLREVGSERSEVERSGT